MLLPVAAAVGVHSALTGGLLVFRKGRRDRSEIALRSRLAPTVERVDRGDSTALAAAVRSDRRVVLDLHRVLAQDKARQDARLAGLEAHPGSGDLVDALRLASLDAHLSGDPAVARAAEEILRALPHSRQLV